MMKSYKGYEYFVTWVDDKSRKVFVDGLWAKLESIRTPEGICHAR
jgi:hypothetical protein